MLIFLLKSVLDRVAAANELIISGVKPPQHRSTIYICEYIDSTAQEHQNHCCIEIFDHVKQTATSADLATSTSEPVMTNSEHDMRSCFHVHYSIQNAAVQRRFQPKHHNTTTLSVSYTVPYNYGSRR